jgi:hypothetical protein
VRQECYADCATISRRTSELNLQGMETVLLVHLKHDALAG